MPGVYNNRETGGSIEILDEGISLTPSASSLDFTGAGVGTTAIGADVTANISGTSVSFSENEVPGGTINGTNDTFTLAQTPDPITSLKLYKNGVRQKAGGADFTLSGTTIIFTANAIPFTGDLLLVDYTY